LELHKITSYNGHDCGGGVFEIFLVQGYVIGYGQRTYTVNVDFRNKISNCQCCKIKKDGIICCHVLKVMSYIGAVKRIPEHYILHRWSRPDPDVVPATTEFPQHPTEKKLSRKDMRMLRYGNMCNDFSRLVVDLAALEKTKEIADKHMKAMQKELADLKRAAADAFKRKKKAQASSSTTADADIEANTTMEHDADLANYRKARDPPITNTKGRPSWKRKKGGLQLQKPNPTVCKVCGDLVHDVHNCPVWLANPEKYPVLSLFQ
jgi:rubrerythrin